MAVHLSPDIEPNEPILSPELSRFVLFPIQRPDVSARHICHTEGP